MKYYIYRYDAGYKGNFYYRLDPDFHPSIVYWWVLPAAEKPTSFSTLLIARLVRKQLCKKLSEKGKEYHIHITQKEYHIHITQKAI